MPFATAFFLSSLLSLFFFFIRPYSFAVSPFLPILTPTAAATQAAHFGSLTLPRPAATAAHVCARASFCVRAWFPLLSRPPFQSSLAAPPPLHLFLIFPSFPSRGGGRVGTAPQSGEPEWENARGRWGKEEDGSTPPAVWGRRSLSLFLLFISSSLYYFSFTPSFAPLLAPARSQAARPGLGWLCPPGYSALFAVLQ